MCLSFIIWCKNAKKQLKTYFTKRAVARKLGICCPKRLKWQGKFIYCNVNQAVGCSSFCPWHSVLYLKNEIIVLLVIISIELRNTVFYWWREDILNPSLVGIKFGGVLKVAISWAKLEKYPCWSQLIVDLSW